MTAAVPPARPESGSLAAVLRSFPAWLVHRLPSVILSALGAAVVAWVVNVWLMAARYDGSQVPPGSAATGSGNFLQGSLFWALLSMLVFAAVGYRRAVGGKQFWRDLRGLPRGLLSLARADGAAARVHLLWGAAAGMAVSVLIGPSLGLVMSLGILVALPSILGNLMSGLVRRAMDGVRRATGPGQAAGEPAGMLSAAVGFLGTALALAAAYVVTDTAVKIVITLGLVVLAVVLGIRSRTAPPTAAVVILAVVAGAELLDVLLSAQTAWADDGGYYECGQSWADWWSNCAGSEGVKGAATVGSAAAAAGGVIGSFLGETAGMSGPAGDPSRTGWIDGLLSDPAFDDFRAQNPDVPMDADGFQQYVDWRADQGLPVPPIPGTGDAGPYGPDTSDAESGDAEDAGGEAAEAPGPPTMILSGAQAMDVLRDLGLVSEVRDPDGTTRYVPTSRLDDLNASGDTFVETATSTDQTGRTDWVQEARITGIGGIAYTHDADGNITSATIIAHHDPVAPDDWTHVRDLGGGVEARGTPEFTQAAADAHDEMTATTAGQTIADELAATGQHVVVRQTHPPGNPDAGNSYQATHGEDRIANADGTNNRGTGGRINFNPDRTQAGDGTEPWHVRPPWVGYAHEFAHARDAAQGAQAPGESTDPGMPAGGNPAHWQVNNREQQATSIGPWAGHPSDENAIRDEIGEAHRDSYAR